MRLNWRGIRADQLMDVRAHLADKGADIILPGMTEVLVLVDVLRSRVSVPLIDSNLAYAEHAVGADPTIGMLATCMRLEANGQNAFVIHCNTAHAFVSSIQRQLDIPIVNMLSEVIAFAREKMPEVSRLGPLATSGTITSRVYHSTAEAAGMTLLVPDASVQARVMESICGADGVKAGFNSGACSSHLAAVIAHLRDQGAQAVILGCTEQPLLDPTGILANSCVRLARKVRVDVASEGVPA
ncbi:hypothetical protein CEW83_11375 [Parazoarcus communis]|uniref:Aspartate racemase n=1 Tax=Parazoarcus communis TaxID=41977 RepID=A0A2U8GPX4_9RHOO|nr:amino acid racemase [Parazoarcus communis]AWI75739.1 hypothetical protein CEW83_11375 [Parazoarcus communis]